MLLSLDVLPREVLFQVAAALSFLVILLGAVRAQEEEKPPQLLSPDGGEACYGRIYDDQHMQSHPRQKVIRIFLFSGGDPVRRPNEEPDSDKSVGSYNSYLTTTLRGATRPDWVQSICLENGTRIRCVMDCDRTLGTLKPDGRGGIVLSDLNRDLYHAPDESEGLSPAKQAEYDKRTLGEDDSRFRLDPLPLATCKAEFARIEPENPALGEPLRKRLKPDQPFCYGRDYDTTHLAKHPEQVTVSVRVQRGVTELSAYATTSKKLWPESADIVVTLTTRKESGKVGQKYSCNPEGNQWRCAAKTANAAASTSASCDVSKKEIFLRRGVDGTMMLGNPNNGLLIGDICTKSEATKSDDKVFRLSPLSLSACGL